METEILQILKAERARLSQQREKNLEKIRILDEKIAKCEQNAREYAIMCYFTDHNIEIYRKKITFIKQGMRFGLFRSMSIAYERIRINFMEQESQFLHGKRTYYQNETMYYREAKKNLENENIDLGNKIFMIDDELQTDTNSDSKEKVLVKREKKQ